MKTLGIDQSYTSTGVCIRYWRTEECTIFPPISTECNKEDPLDYMKRATIISKKVMEIIENVGGVNALIIEGLAMGGVPGNQARNLSGLQFLIITKVLEEYPSIDIKVIAPTTVKKKATGSGRGKKEELFDALPLEIKEEIGKYKKTKGRYDLTDAYWLSTFYGEEEWVTENL